MTPPCSTKNVPKTREVIADNLMRMLIEGPDVSFNGSPTVSPTTAALCASECFLKTYNSSPSSSSPSFSFETFVPASIYFFALSQAPPVLENENAI